MRTSVLPDTADRARGDGPCRGRARSHRRPDGNSG